MEDRYLFRGKRTDTGEWIIGSLLVDKQQDIETGEQIEIIGIYPSEYKDFAKKIDPSTVCQCTGLKDKNGKLIWENDIVKEFNSVGDEWQLSQVVFGEYSLNPGWCIKGIKTLHEFNHSLVTVGFRSSKAAKCDVIGNIFDNPELLEWEGNEE